jgi:ABC-type sugar transport system ATPase subunit
MLSKAASMPLLVARGVSKHFGAVEALIDLIEHRRDQGLAVVIISHNLDIVFHVADRISVLRLGRHVGTFDRRTASREDVVAAITGALSRRAVAA